MVGAPRFNIGKPCFSFAGKEFASIIFFSASLKILAKVRVITPAFGKPEGRTADPSTTLRSGGDDNVVWER